MKRVEIPEFRKHLMIHAWGRGRVRASVYTSVFTLEYPSDQPRAASRSCKEADTIAAMVLGPDCQILWGRGRYARR